MLDKKTINAHPAPKTTNISNLTFVKSKFPIPDKNSSRYFSHIISKEKSNKKRDHTLVGLEISTKNKAFDKLIVTIADPTKNNTPATVANLNIYCDIFTLTRDLFIPEANITIHAREIRGANKYKIISSPLQWGKDKIGAGVNGEKAGDVTIITDKPIQFTIEANGSDGTPAWKPVLNTIPVKYVISREIHFNEGNTEGETLKKGLKKECSFEGKKIYGIKMEYIGGTFWNNTSGYIQIDSENIIEKGKKVVDRLENKRIINRKRILPGKRGAAGKINIYVSKNESSITYSAKSGKNSCYFDKKTLSKLVKPEDFIFPQKKYYLGVVEMLYHKIPGYIYGYSEKVSFNKINTDKEVIIPSDSELKELGWIYEKDNKRQSFLKLPSWDKLPDAVIQGSVHQKKYLPHLLYIDLKMEFLADNFRIIHQLSKQEKSGVFGKKDKDGNFIEDKITTFKSIITEILKDKDSLSRQKISNLQNYHLTLTKFSKEGQGDLLDIYGHKVGYRPLLSLQMTMTYIKGAMQRDVEQYVLANRIADDQGSLEKLKIPLEATEKNIIKQNIKLIEKLNELTKKIPSIQGKAKRCLDKLEGKHGLIILLSNEINELREEVRNKEAIKEAIKSIVTVVNVMISTVPFWQPNLSKVSNIITNGVIDSNFEKEEMLGKVLNQGHTASDLLLQGIANGKVRSFGYFDGTEDVKIRKNLLEANEGMLKIELDAVVYGEHASAIRSLKSAVAKSKKLLNNVEEETGLKKRKERFARMSTAISTLTRNLARKSISVDDMNKLTDAACANSGTIAKRRFEINTYILNKRDLVEELLATLQKINRINTSLIENESNLLRIRKMLEDLENYSSEDLAMDMRQLERSALDRLSWADYHLTKVYEYTTLKTYEPATDLPSTAIMKKMDELRKAPSTFALKATVSDLTKVYEANFNKLRHSLLTDLSEGHQQDSKKAGQGRKIELSEENFPALMKDLNQGKLITVNLLRDFIERIIDPTQQDIRLVDMQVDKIVLAEKTGESSQFELTTELGEIGYLRKNNQIFHVNTEASDSPKRWRWTINGNEEITNASEASSGYEALIKFVSGKNNGAKESIFTSPPAWTDMHIKVRNKSRRKELPKIKKIIFNVQCAYMEKSRGTDKILDVRINGTPNDFIYKIEKSINKSTPEPLSCNLYTTESSKDKIIIIGPKNIADFKGWKVSPKYVASFDKTGKIATIEMKENVLIQAIMAEPSAAEPAQKKGSNAQKQSVQKEDNGAAKKAEAVEPRKVKLYAASSNDAKVVGETYEEVLIPFLEEGEDIENTVSGEIWIKILYNGEPAFVKDTDLEL